MDADERSVLADRLGPWNLQSNSGLCVPAHARPRQAIGAVPHSFP
jgi:hypothetical protein